MGFELTVTGIVSDGFTSVEISGAQGRVARVFELPAGWYVELSDPALLRDTALVEAIQEAKEALLLYPNRTGVGMPDGLTAAAASLWLMQRTDGKGFFTVPRK